MILRSQLHLESGKEFLAFDFEKCQTGKKKELKEHLASDDMSPSNFYALTF